MEEDRDLRVPSLEELDLTPALYDREPLAAYLSQLKARGLLSRVHIEAGVSETTVDRALRSVYTVEGFSRRAIYRGALIVETQLLQARAAVSQPTAEATQTCFDSIRRTIRMGIRYPCGRTYHLYGMPLTERFGFNYWRFTSDGIVADMERDHSFEQCPNNETGNAIHIQDSDLSTLAVLVGLEQNVWKDRSIR